MKKLLLILLCLPMIGFGQCISGDCENGYGTRTWKWAHKGEKYVGEWKFGMRNGQGINIYGNGPNKGDEYVGEWKNDRPHGQGTYTYERGDKYVGEFKNGNMNGQGTYTWAKGPSKGDKYVGKWWNGMKNGQGTYTWIKGPYKGEYVGEWLDEMRHGEGIHFFANGEKKQGEWVNDKLIKSYEIDDSNDPDTTENLITENKKDESNTKKNASNELKGLKELLDLDLLTKEEYNIKAEELKKIILQKKNQAVKHITLISSVDKNIPINSKVDNRFALVIGNEDYTSFQTTLSSEQNVDYAFKDATIFKKYCLNTLGVKEDNMFFLLNATAGQMSQEIDLISKILSKLGDESELIVYYAGHGYPDELTKIPYLIPVDVSATNLSSAIKLSEIYTKLSSTGASKVTVFLDACFTGGGRNSGLIASRGVKVKPKEGSLSGNLVVFSASSGDQSSLPYHKEGHGMFTYHLLKKLQETKGDVSMGELSDYLDDSVSLQSLKENKKEQDPKVNTSQKVINDWRNWKF